MMILLQQPYGAFAKALLERQEYPNLRNQNGQPQQPYDVTAHSLALLMNVSVVPVKARFNYHYDVDYMGFAVDGEQTYKTRLALYKSHVAAIDEGWTRWALQHIPLELAPRTNEPGWGVKAFDFSSVEDREIQSGKLIEEYDHIIIPDQPRAAILNGHRKGTMPEEYTGGLGAEGVKALREFVEQGGTLICLNRASEFAIEQFKLPVRNVVAELPRTDFYVPGSILRIELDPTNPIAKGMPKESIAWVENSPVFEVIDGRRGSSPTVREGSAGGASALRVKVIAWYPKDKDPLLSGWLLGADRIKGKAALVEVTLGKGRIILFGFRPQYRGQSLATYPLFFNAITER
jgi:hypothetical protein